MPRQLPATRPGRRLAILLAMALLPPALAALDDRPRLVVTTDIGGDPDDTQSLVRLLVFANEFDLEGLIASASGTPGELAEAMVRPDLVHQLVAAYARVFPHLDRQAAGYPAPAHLRSLVHAGNPRRGPDAVGEHGDTAASRWLIALADRPDPRPLNLAIWGGQTDLAQAAWRVERERGAAGRNAFLARLRIYDINDQDGMFAWMHARWAFPFYVLAQAPPGRDKREGVYRGMYLGGDESLTSRDWLNRFVRQGHGPLGALYPDRTWTAPNPHGALKEGDTPSWFFFLPHGLNDPAHPEWGGWGGRFQSAGHGLWRDAGDGGDRATDARTTVSRWRDAFQRAFAARMDWCVEAPAEANHAPRLVVEGDASRAVLHRRLPPGERLVLDATASTDPDGDPLRFRWWVYPEAGDWVGAPPPAGEGGRWEWTVPAGASPGTLHLIVEATDDGDPVLTSYRRVVLTVAPAGTPDTGLTGRPALP